MRRITVIGAVIVCSALVASPAPADVGVFHDRDERPFCEGPGECPDHDYMDFRTLMQGHGGEDRLVRHEIRTFKRWRSKWLGGRYGTTIALDFDVDRGDGADRGIRIRRKNGRLWAAMFRGKYFNRRVSGQVRVWRPNRRSVKVEFAADMLQKGITEYRWQASWWHRRLSCPGSCNNDWAPDRGWYAHLL